MDQLLSGYQMPIADFYVLACLFLQEGIEAVREVAAMELYSVSYAGYEINSLAQVAIRKWNLIQAMCS